MTDSTDESPDDSLEPADELTPDDRNTLEAIFQAGWASEWPIFALLERKLGRDGLDSGQVLLPLIPSFVRRQGSGSRIGDEEVISLTVRGIASTKSGLTVLPTILSAIQFLVQYEISYEPTRQAPRPRVVLDDIVVALSMNRPVEVASQLAEAVVTVLINEPGIFEASGGSGLEWTGTISRDIRRYTGIASIDDYLAATPKPAPLLPTSTSPDVSAPEEDLASGQPDESTRIIANARLGSEVPASYRTHPQRTPEPEPGSGRDRVFLVHGRNVELNEIMSDLLQSFGLDVVTWEAARTQAAKNGPRATPYLLDIIEAGFALATGIVVLFTPDDLVELHPDLSRREDPKGPAMQPRPNVLLEAGMAFAKHPANTVIVEIGHLRGLSDLSGLHAIRFDGTKRSRLQLVSALTDASIRATDPTPELDTSEGIATLLASFDIPESPLDEGSQEPRYAQRTAQTIDGSILNELVRLRRAQEQSGEVQPLDVNAMSIKLNVPVRDVQDSLARLVALGHANAFAESFERGALDGAVMITPDGEASALRYVLGQIRPGGSLL